MSHLFFVVLERFGVAAVHLCVSNVIPASQLLLHLVQTVTRVTVLHQLVDSVIERLILGTVSVDTCHDVINVTFELVRTLTVRADTSKLPASDVADVLHTDASGR